MTKISENLFLLKKVFPLFWFGFLSLFLAAALVGKAYLQTPVFVLAPLLMAGFGYVVMRKIVWDLADEVYDAGDHLLVKKDDIEERIPLSNIVNVSVVMLMNPPRITLLLNAPSRFGREIAFSPKRGLTLNPFARNAVADDLILRVDRARRGG